MWIYPIFVRKNYLWTKFKLDYEETANTPAFYRRFWDEPYRISHFIGGLHIGTLPIWLWLRCFYQNVQWKWWVRKWTNWNPIEIQLKSTDHLKYSVAKKAILFDLDQRDLELWLNSNITFIFIVYDALKKVAYWIDLEDYFKINRAKLKKVNKFFRIYIPDENVFTDATVQKFRKIKNN